MWTSIKLLHNVGRATLSALQNCVNMKFLMCTSDAKNRFSLGSRCEENGIRIINISLTLAHVGGLVTPPKVFLSYTPNRFR